METQEDLLARKLSDPVTYTITTNIWSLTATVFSVA
jgi:hypothetical protein